MGGGILSGNQKGKQGETSVVNTNEEHIKPHKNTPKVYLILYIYIYINIYIYIYIII